MEEDNKMISPEALKFFSEHRALKDFLTTLSDEDLSTALENISRDINNSIGIYEDILHESINRNNALIHEDSNITSQSK